MAKRSRNRIFHAAGKGTFPFASSGGVLCLVLAFFSLQANDRYIFKHINVKDGLSQGSVFAIAQDRAGFLWLGTRDGLNRYDGARFKHYRHDAANPRSLASNDVRAIYCDPSGNAIWIGTPDGVSRYDPDADTFSNYLHSGDNTSPSATSVRCIFRDSKKRLWLGTDKGIVRYDSERDTFLLGAAAGLGGVNTLFEDRRGILWAGTDVGLGRVVYTKKGEVAIAPVLHPGARSFPMADYQIKACIEDAAGNLWIGTEQGGLYYWDRGAQRLRSFRYDAGSSGSLSNDRVRSLTFGPDSSLWVGTFLGLNRYHGQRRSFQRFLSDDAAENGLSNSSIRTIFFDRSGGMWVGTYHGGISYSAPGLSRFQNYTHLPKRNSISSNIVSSFAEDDRGNLWIGTEGGGLNYWDRERQAFSTYPVQGGDAKPGIAGYNVKALLKDGQRLWVGFFQVGLYAFDLQSKTFRHYEVSESETQTELNHSNVYSLLKAGGRLWIATYGGGLNVLDLSRQKFYYYHHAPSDPHSLSSDLTRVLYQDRRGQVWLGTEKGLNRVFTDSATGLPQRFQRYLPGVQVYSILEDVKGRFWVGTFSHGLFMLDPRTGRSTRFTEADGLPGHTIFGILADSSGKLWLSTNNGLSNMDPERRTFTNYHYSNGLKNIEFNFNGYYKTQAGEMLFGGMNGFTVFQPSDFSPNPVAPSVVLSELKMFEQEVRANDKTRLLSTALNNAERITFRYNEAVFAIGFAALDYLNPGSNQYAYKLEGLDKDWNYRVGQAEARYTIQRPGLYRFRLRAGNSDGVWNPRERVLEIKVLPPPWRSTPAYIGYIFLALFAIVGIFNFLQMRHRLQIEHLSKLQQEALNEMKLRFFTNITHEFRTPLTLILGPLDDLIRTHPEGELQKPLQSIRRNAQRLLNLVNQVLTFRKLESDYEHLAVVRGDLVALLRDVCQSFDESARLRNIRLRFVSVENSLIAWFDRDKLEKVAFNLLSNAFKFTPDHGEIELSVYQNSHSAFFQIKDNGIGIKAEWHEEIFRRFNERLSVPYAPVQSSGIGLAMCRQLIALHHGSIRVESAEHQGAVFIVELPLGHAHFKEEELTGGEIPVTAPAFHPIPAEAAATGKLLPAHAPTLLLVEDNPEILAYVQGFFQASYRVLTAADGKAALQVARKQQPDLIISDIMMPEMDGIAFCRTLKTEIPTSHIPVILLTANSADPVLISGLENGADDYITKPFNPEELRLRVRNLLQSRKQFREKFARVLHLEPSEITVTSADEDFLRRALAIVEKHIANPDFDVEQFARELVVSRPVLFAKLKALTDQTPNNFVKTIRLKRAAQLLSQGKLPIAEVGFQTGFPDARYFRKAFQKQFGCSPSEYEALPTPPSRQNPGD